MNTSIAPKEVPVKVANDTSSSPKKSWIAWLALLIVLAATAAVRLPATGWGLPYEYGYDEPEIMLPAIRIIREGIYIPYKFDYGPLNGYVHAAWGALSFIRGSGEDRFPDSIWGIQSDNVTGWYWSVTSDWFLRQARYLSVLLSLVSVACIYLSAMRLWGSVASAIWAAAVMGLNATFAFQTSLVSADATTIAAASVCVWSCCWIYTTKARWAYVLAGVSAAATLAFKYNNVFIVLLPVLAHFLHRRNTSAKAGDHLPIVQYVIVLCLLSALLLLPVFLKPVKFLSDVATVLSYYIKPQDSNIVSSTIGYFQRYFSLLDMGQLQVPGKDLVSFSQISYDFTLPGLVVVLVTSAGIVASAIVDRRLFLLLIPVALLNFLNTGGDTGFFYPRYLLLSLPFLSLLGGFAIWMLLANYQAYRKRTAIIASLAFVGLIPYSAHTLGNTYSMSNIVDPRLKLADYMWTNVEEGNKVLILDETRWKSTPAEQKRWQVSRAMSPQIMLNPELLKSFDYLIAPTEVFFHSPTSMRSNLASMINAWLDDLPEEAVGYGSEPIAFDGPDVQPAVQLIRLQSMPSQAQKVPVDSVFGMAFQGPPGSHTLGNGVIAIRSGNTVTSVLEVATTASKVIVRAQGTAPYQQKVLPRLELSFVPLETTSQNVTKNISITMGRNQSGIHDYEAPVDLPAGKYQVRVAAKDEDNFLIRLESVSVAP